MNTNQMQNLDRQRNAYLESVRHFLDCIDLQVVKLDINDPEYDAKFENLLISMDLVEQQKLMAREKFNQHISTLEVEDLRGVDSNFEEEQENE